MECPYCHKHFTMDRYRRGNPSKKEGLFSSKHDMVARNGYVDAWNAMNPPFKHTQIWTKVYKTSSKYFTQLEQGSFWLDKDADERWVRMHKIDKQKKWGKGEIVETLRKLVKLYHKWQFESKGISLPKSLAVLLWNPYSRKSLFHNAAEIETKRVYSRGNKQDIIAEGFRI